MWPFSWFMKPDPTKDNPPPRGKSSVLPLIAFIVVAGFAAKGCQVNEPTPHTPVPHSTISPEDVERLP